MGNNTHSPAPGNLNSQDVSTTFPRSCARFSHLPPPRMDESWRWRSASFVGACAVTRGTTGARRSPRTAQFRVSVRIGRIALCHHGIPARYSRPLSYFYRRSRSKTHAVHTHTHTQIRCTVCPIISRRDCYSRPVASKIKGVVLERSSSTSYLYIRALYPSFRVPGVSYLASGTLSTPSDPIHSSSFSPPVQQPAVYHACTCSVSSLRATRFRQSDGLHPWIQICYVLPLVYVVVSPMDSL